MADEGWQERMNKPGYKNWIKVSRALIEAKKALHGFTKEAIEGVHAQMKSVVGPGTCTKTAACNTNKGEPKCPSCSLWVKEIRKSYRGNIIWKNTDPSRWHEFAWEIAKCYMNAQGSKETARAVTGPENTDLSGILNVLVNCKEIRDNRFKKKKLPEEVRNVRNKLMHCAEMSLSEKEMRDMVDKIIALLEDEKELKKLPVCQNKVECIKSLKNCKFKLKQDDEEQCFEEVLKSYKLAVELKENGEDIELDSFKVFKEVFKEYKDLQRFSEKVSDVEKEVKRMKQEYDAKFSAIYFEYGELKGKVQYIYEKLQTSNIENLQQQTLYVNDINIRPSYTAVLHNIAQKKKKEPPKYTENSDGKKFTANVLFDGKTFSCKEAKSSKKEAKESAAVYFLGQQDIQLQGDNVSFNESVEATTNMDNLQAHCHLLNSKSYKNQLQERAQKNKIPYPIYHPKDAKEGFAFDIKFDGRWYLPDIKPQTKKVDAEQMAAEFVLRFLESEEKKECVNGTDSTDGNLSKSSCNHLQTHENEESNQSTPADDCDQPCTPIGHSEVKPGDNLQKEKNYRSQLNEYLQKKNEKSPKYEDEKLDSGQFQSLVTVLGKTFTGEGSSKKKSQEMAAMEAYKYFNLKSTEIDNDTDSSTAIVSCVDESLIHTSYQNAVGQSPSDISTLATREELEVAENTTTNSTTTGIKAIVHLSKDFKTDLKEFAEKRNYKVQYDTIKSKDKTTECFLSKVFVGRRCFIGKQQKSKIKEAEKHVAEIALSIMKEKKHDMDYSCKDTLNKYHKDLGFSDYPDYEKQQPAQDDEEFIMEIKVKKKFEIKCDKSKPSKKDLKKCLVEMAIQRLEDEKKTIPNGDNASSRFHEFIQSEKGETKKEFCIEESQPHFTGLLRFYIVEIYESLISCSTEEEAVISAAMSASNALDLL